MNINMIYTSGILLCLAGSLVLYVYDMYVLASLGMIT